MTGPSSTQIVSVSLALAGEQTARIDTNHAGTPQARLHILWGALMLTLTSPTQTGYLLDVWQRAAASPATVRSRMISRSNWARAAKTWKTSLPPGVVVSIDSRRLRNPTSRCSRAVTVSMRCRSERPSRSRRHTTRVSPGRSASMTSSRAGRRPKVPEAWSVYLPAPGGGELVGLQRRVLLRGRHPRVPEEMTHGQDRSENIAEG